MLITFGKQKICLRLVHKMLPEDVYNIYMKSFFFLLCFVFSFWPQGIFGNATEILKPLRYEFVKIGGSNAQVSERLVRY